MCSDISVTACLAADFCSVFSGLSTVMCRGCWRRASEFTNPSLSSDRTKTDRSVDSETRGEKEERFYIEKAIEDVLIQ